MVPVNGKTTKGNSSPGILLFQPQEESKAQAEAWLLSKMLDQEENFLFIQIQGGENSSIVGVCV